jgi:hypothetical protein
MFENNGKERFIFPSSFLLRPVATWSIPIAFTTSSIRCATSFYIPSVFGFFYDLYSGVSWVNRRVFLAIGADGLGLISYSNYSQYLSTAHFDNVACSNLTISD